MHSCEVRLWLAAYKAIGKRFKRLPKLGIRINRAGNASGASSMVCPWTTDQTSIASSAASSLPVNSRTAHVAEPCPVHGLLQNSGLHIGRLDPEHDTVKRRIACGKGHIGPAHGDKLSRGPALILELASSASTKMVKSGCGNRRQRSATFLK